MWSRRVNDAHSPGGEGRPGRTGIRLEGSPVPPPAPRPLAFPTRCGGPSWAHPRFGPCPGWLTGVRDCKVGRALWPGRRLKTQATHVPCSGLLSSLTKTPRRGLNPECRTGECGAPAFPRLHDARRLSFLEFPGSTIASHVLGLM